MITTLFNLFGGIRLFIGIILLLFGCFLDFDLYYIGTGIRFLSGLIGAYCIVGNAKEGGGYIVGLILGIVIYSMTIKGGVIELGGIPFIPDQYVLDGWNKILVRTTAAFMFILGVRDVQNS